MLLRATLCLIAAVGTSAFAPASCLHSDARARKASTGLRAQQSCGDTVPANAAGLLEAKDDSKRFTFYCGTIRFGRELSKDGLPGSGMSDKYTKLIGAEISSPDPEDFELVQEIVEGGYDVSYGNLRRACLVKPDYKNDAWSGAEDALSLLRKVIVRDAEIVQSANKKAAEEEAKKNYVSWAEQQRQAAAGRAPPTPNAPSPADDVPGPFSKEALTGLVKNFQKARATEQSEYEARASWAASESTPEPVVESTPEPAAESTPELAAESTPEPAAESTPGPAADEGGPSPLSGEALAGFVKSFPIFSVFGGKKGDD